jgi:hypothetical protein
VARLKTAKGISWVCVPGKIENFQDNRIFRGIYMKMIRYIVDVPMVVWGAAW